MVTIMTRIKVQDYGRWKEVFDSAEPMRKAAGELGVSIYRSELDGNEIVLLGSWPDENTARRFLNSEPLRVGKPDKGWWIEHSGVTDGPDVYLLSDLGLAH